MRKLESITNTNTLNIKREESEEDKKILREKVVNVFRLTINPNKFYWDLQREKDFVVFTEYFDCFTKRIESPF